MDLHLPVLKRTRFTKDLAVYQRICFRFLYKWMHKHWIRGQSCTQNAFFIYNKSVKNSKIEINLYTSYHYLKILFVVVL